MKVGFGIIGCGHIASRHADAIMNSELLELRGVCDVNPSAAGSFGEKYGVKWYTGVADLLSDPSIDAVSICTPSGLRVEIGLKAAESGKHLVVEKPMALSLEGADRLIESCRSKELKLAVMHQNRFIPAVRRMIRSVKSGRLGKLTHGSAVVRWNRNDEYYAKAPWRGTRAMDGGCLLNQAIHNIDLLQYALGEARMVFGLAATQLRKIETEDNAVALLKFSNGSFGTIEASTTIYPTNLEETLSIFGSDGAIVLGGTAMGKIRTWRLKGDNEEDVLAEQELELELPRYACHQAVLEDMARAIVDNRQPAVDGYEGRKALAIIDGIYRSHATGKPVYFNNEEKDQP